MCLSKKGELFSWGRNNYGQLGISDKGTIKSNKPRSIVLQNIKIIDFS